MLGEIILKTCWASPFAVSICADDSTPKDLDQFFNEFINKINLLIVNRFTFNNIKFSIKLLGFTFDAPARAFIKDVKGYNSLHGCERCKQKAVSLNHRTVSKFDPNYVLR